MTIEYYDQNAQDFVNSTVDVDMQSLYKPFVDLLPVNALILDAGCGSGRDTKAFLKMGFHVEAFDASEEMVKYATSHTGIDVQHSTFQSVDYIEQYDAIWACASLLHVSKCELSKVFARLSASLKAGGIWYFSFKYGSEERTKDGRTFTDMNEAQLELLISRFSELNIVDVWQTTDARPERDEKWLNAIVTKTTDASSNQ